MTHIDFREPIESDLAHLILLNRLHKHKFLADGETLPDDTILLKEEHGFNLEEMREKRAIVFTVTEDTGLERVIGSADFTDINHDLTAILHFIIDPAYLRQFLREKVYLDALIDRFRVLRVKKLLVVSEFFATTAQKIALRIGFQRVATLTDIVRQKVWDGQTFHYIVGDLHYFELTRKDLAEAIRAHFVAEESQETQPNVQQQEESQRQPRAEKPDIPIRDADEQGQERELQPDIPAGPAGHTKPSPKKRSKPVKRSIADSDGPISGPNGKVSGGLGTLITG